MAAKLMKYLVSMMLIFTSLWMGNALQALLESAIPGSVLGMLILFGLLSCGVVSPDWVKPSATLFIRYMVLLFVPVSVGLMLHAEMLMANAWPILAGTIGASMIVLVFLASFLDRLLKRGNQ